MVTGLQRKVTRRTRGLRKPGKSEKKKKGKNSRTKPDGGERNGGKRGYR